MHDSAGAFNSVSSTCRFCRRHVLTLLLMFAAVAIGCGERNGTPHLHESNLRMVAVLYSQFVSAHGGEHPRDADEFRAFVQSLGPGVLERAGLAGLDELLLSSRDGQPFAINYKSVHWKLDNVIAYEQQGAGGTRSIVSDLGAVSEITEQQFQGRIKEAL